MSVYYDIEDSYDRAVAQFLPCFGVGSIRVQLSSFTLEFDTVLRYQASLTRLVRT
jgi:hypothetical protein